MPVFSMISQSYINLVNAFSPQDRTVAVRPGLYFLAGIGFLREEAEDAHYYRMAACVVALQDAL